MHNWCIAFLHHPALQDRHWLRFTPSEIGHPRQLGEDWSVIWGEGFELGDVKYRMDAAVWRQLQAICQGSNPLCHFKRAEELVGELAARAVGNGGLSGRLKLEEDLFADVEGSFCSVSIRLFLEASLVTRKLRAQQVRVHGPI